MTWKVSSDLASFVELLNSSCIFSCLHASMLYAMYNLRYEKQFFEHSYMHDVKDYTPRSLWWCPLLGKLLLIAANIFIQTYFQVFLQSL
jgi:lipid-A-disaccharide synthase-like uncharacterized protein